MTNPTALDAFLGTTAEAEKTVYLKRLGIDLRVKALTGAQVTKLREQATYSEGKGSKRKSVTNEEEFGGLLISTSCIEPDFGDAKLLAHYNARDAADCVQKALLAGEVAMLSHAVLDVSGFVNDEDEVEEVKN